MYMYIYIGAFLLLAAVSVYLFTKSRKGMGYHNNCPRGCGYGECGEQGYWCWDLKEYKKGKCQSCAPITS